MEKVKRFFEDFLTVSRVEFVPATVSTMWIGYVLTVGSFPSLFARFPFAIKGFIWYMIVFLLIGQTNALADYDLDKTGKPQVPKAIDSLGKRKLIAIILVEFAAIVYLALNLALQLNPMLAILCFTGVALGLAYSLEPIRLKKRGLLHSVTLIMIITVYPILFGSLIAGNPSSLVLAVVVGIAMLEYSVSLITACRDYSKDNIMNIRTPAVVAGPKIILKVSFAINTAGSSIVFLAISSATLARGTVFTALSSILLIYSFSSIFIKQYRLLEKCRPLRDGDSIARMIHETSTRYHMWPAFLKFPILIASLLTLSLE